MAATAATLRLAISSGLSSGPSACSCNVSALPSQNRPPCGTRFCAESAVLWPVFGARLVPTARATCCGTELFASSSKFESGTGWPSFSQPAADNVVAYHVDNSHGMTRVEAVCSTCDAHLGHVFPDGPPPSRLRYCMNALSLKKFSAD